MKRGFTLMEVTLAMLIMASGILSIVGLYSLGYRESQQSREDVASAAYAEAVLSALTTACSATNVTWEAFNGVTTMYPRNGWADYLNTSTWICNGDPQSQAQQAYEAVMKQMPKQITFPDMSSSTGMRAALVVCHEADSPVIKFCFRAVKKDFWGTLMSMPVYYTEVSFQGVSQ